MSGCLVMIVKLMAGSSLPSQRSRTNFSYGLIFTYLLLILFPKFSYRQCTKHKGDDTKSKAYLKWFAEHADLCPKNFDGPSQAMEAEGISRLFDRLLVL